jgi:hypothetical protein
MIDPTDRYVSRRDFIKISGAFGVALGAVGGGASTALGASDQVAAALGQPAGGTAEARNMDLVGFVSLQARSCYQPLVHHYTTGGQDKWIFFGGNHGGEALNPLTGQIEPNGTGLVDVSDPSNPKYLSHIPGAPGGTEAGGAQMVRVVDGKSLPQGDPNKVYLLRTFGSDGHQVYDVTDPTHPERLTTIITGLDGTHKNWWEPDTGIAYLVCDGRGEGWRTNRMTKVYDLSNPASPRFIRNFGLVGQEPGSTMAPVPAGVHGPIARGNRVYYAYGTSSEGVIQILDREKLLNGNPESSDPFDDTPENLLYPQIGRLDMNPQWGAHTTFPVLGMRIADFATDREGALRDFLVVPSEATQNECQSVRHLTFMVDITNEAKPFSVATYEVPESSGNFCSRGGRFGPHATSESFAAPYYGKLIFISYFNAGVRTVDIRDPFNPREVGFFIPPVTAETDKRCITVGGAEQCKVAIQTNNVEYDERGFIYIVDRANTGLHILKLSGDAQRIAAA